MGEHELIGVGGDRCHLQRVEHAQRITRQAASGEQELLAVCAHELRNPLSSLQSTLELLRGSLPSPVLDQHLEILQRQTRKLERIVSDLFDASRAGQATLEMQLERVDMAVIVARALESTRHFVEERRHTVSFTSPERAVYVMADALRLEQVLVNLLVNAAKFTDSGGRLSLELKRCEQAVELRVRDNGIGMTQQAIARAFDLFVQVGHEPARSRTGLGLGLALVKQLVELHGGTVRAASPGLGRGSEFVVALPLAADGHDREGQEPERGEPSVGRKSRRRVLVVDDNHDVADALARLIDHLGHAVRVAADGPTALRVASEWNPEIVFLDICLPNMDGYAVAREIVRTRSQPPLLIALTGYAEQSVTVRARAAGFAKHLVKPPRLSAIAAVLHCLDSADAVREP